MVYLDGNSNIAAIPFAVTETWPDYMFDEEPQLEVELMESEILIPAFYPG